MSGKTQCLLASAKLARIQQKVAPELALRWNPTDEEGVSEAAGRFTEHVDTHCFPIFWFGELGAEAVLELLEGPIPITPLGYDPWDGEDRYHEYGKDDPVRMFLLLMELFHLQGSDEEMWECYYELIEKWEILDPAPIHQMYLMLELLLPEDVEAAEWMGEVPVEMWWGMMHFCQYLVSSTENFFLDATLAMLGYMEDGWWDDAEHAKAEWARARPIWDSLLSFRAWAREHVEECQDMVRKVCDSIGYDLSEIDLVMEEGDEEE